MDRARTKIREEEGIRCHPLAAGPSHTHTLIPALTATIEAMEQEKHTQLVYYYAIHYYDT